MQSSRNDLRGNLAMPVPRYVSEASDLKSELLLPSSELSTYHRGMALCGMNRETERWFRRVWTRPELKPDAEVLCLLSQDTQKELSRLAESGELNDEERKHFDDMIQNVSMRVKILESMASGDLSWDHKQEVNRLVESYIDEGQKLLLQCG